MPDGTHREIDFECLDHQHVICSDEVTRVLALKGGLGSAKTSTLALKSAVRASRWPGVPHLFLEPTWDLIGSIYIPSIEKLYGEGGVHIPWVQRARWSGRDDVVVLWPNEPSRETIVYTRSGDKPVRIVGMEVGTFLADECDQMPEDAWRRGRARCRFKREGMVRQSVAAFTPELGYKWTYSAFEEDPYSSQHLIEGLTTQGNTYLPSDYVGELSEDYAGEDLERVLTGKRTQPGGLTYRRLQPHHIVDVVDMRAGTPVMGCDFNTAWMHWVLGIVIHGEVLHVFDEIVGRDTDTFEQIGLALRRWGEVLGCTAGEAARRVMVYADSSAGARHVAAPKSSKALLREAGFRVYELAANPEVDDRVTSVNTRLRKDKLFVSAKAKHLVRAMKTQPNDKVTGKPVKAKDGEFANLDHGPDALGYIVWCHPDWRVQSPRGNARKYA